MSFYENEQGTLTLSVVEFAKFRKSLRDEYARGLAMDFEVATQVHERCAKIGRQRPEAGWSELLLEQTPDRGMRVTTHDQLYTLMALQEVPVSPTGEPQARGIFGYGNRIERTRLAKPKKKDFAPPSLTTASYSVISDYGYEVAGISLDHKLRKVRWTVPQGNRVVEEAWESWLGRVFFKLLSQVNWTRGTGGTFYGNNEANRDCEGEGGGGNFVTLSYGIGSKPPARKRSTRRSM